MLIDTQGFSQAVTRQWLEQVRQLLFDQSQWPRAVVLVCRSPDVQQATDDLVGSFFLMPRGLSAGESNAFVKRLCGNARWTRWMLLTPGLGRGLLVWVLRWRNQRTTGGTRTPATRWHRRPMNLFHSWSRRCLRGSCVALALALAACAGTPFLPASGPSVGKVRDVQATAGIAVRELDLAFVLERGQLVPVPGLSGLPEPVRLNEAASNSVKPWKCPSGRLRRLLCWVPAAMPAALPARWCCPGKW